MMKYYLFTLLCLLLAACKPTTPPTAATLTPEEAQKMHTQLQIGQQDSPIEIYVFTDWGCPACKQLEPALEKMAPEMMKNASVVFVDLPIHPITTNYSPYNLSFMIHDKQKYILIRHELDQLSLHNPTPTQEQIKNIVSLMGVRFIPLDEQTIRDGTNYNDYLIQKFDVNRTPTMVIFNKNTQKRKNLVGLNQINESTVLSTIEDLKK